MNRKNTELLQANTGTVEATLITAHSFTSTAATLGGWQDNFLQTWTKPFFWLSLILKTIKSLWRTLGFFASELFNSPPKNRSLGDWAEYILDVGVTLPLLAILVIGGTALLASIHNICLTLLLTLDIAANLCKTIYFTGRWAGEKIKETFLTTEKEAPSQEKIHEGVFSQKVKIQSKKTFFGQKAFQSLVFTGISAAATLLFSSSIVFAGKIAAPFAAGMSALGGAVFLGFAVAFGREPAKALVKKISKIPSQLKRWWNKEPSNKVRPEIKETLIQNNQSTVSIHNKFLVKGAENKNRRHDDVFNSLDYHEYQGLPAVYQTTLKVNENQDLIFSERQANQNSKRLTAFKEEIADYITSLSTVDDQKHQDKKNALIALQQILDQWERFLSNDLSTNDHSSYNKLTFYLKPNSDNKDDLKLITIENLKYVPTFFQPNESPTQEQMANLNKQTHRALKLIRAKILTEYPKAFDTWRERGKVESLFDQAFHYMQRSAEEKIYRERADRRNQGKSMVRKHRNTGRTQNNQEQQLGLDFSRITALSQ